MNVFNRHVINEEYVDSFIKELLGYEIETNGLRVVKKGKMLYVLNDGENEENRFIDDIFYVFSDRNILLSVNLLVHETTEGFRTKFYKIFS